MDCTNGQTNVLTANNTARATTANAKGVCQPSMVEVYPVIPRDEIKVDVVLQIISIHEDGA